MKYGELPKSLGVIPVSVDEMFFYQYLPVKLSGELKPLYEQRLKIFDQIIGVVSCHYIGEFGLNKFRESYMYITAKHLFQKPNCEFNRPGYHSDGFMTDDINYIWCDNNPTVFNDYDFNLSQDCELSLKEMELQALNGKEITYLPNELLMLNQFNIHKVATIEAPGMRTFLKVSFSTEKYNLIGNSHNYLLDYNWDMQPRKIERNHPIA